METDALQGMAKVTRESTQSTTIRKQTFNETTVLSESKIKKIVESKKSCSISTALARRASAQSWFIPQGKPKRKI